MSEIIERLRQTVATYTPEQTEALAADLALVLPADCVLALRGDLGAGKSTFVRGLARGWGITQPITSPTYNLMNLYHGSRQLVHVDAYRLENPEEAEALLLEDLLQSPWCLAIEWPERMPAYWLEHAWHFELGIDGDAHWLRLV